MPRYEEGDFDPPAPVVMARVRAEDGTTSVSDVPMLLDTGSDTSVVPLSAAKAAGASLRPYPLPVQSYDGTRVFRDEASLTVEFLSFRFRGAFLVDNVSIGILGRNVLNALLVTLDGPNLTWTARRP